MEFLDKDDWRNFCIYITKQNRFVLNSKWKCFIKVILDTAKKREHRIKCGAYLVRARIGSDWEEKECTERGIKIDHYPLNKKEISEPPSEKALNGRANPYGISYLYLANDLETALAEVRPWLKQEVTVGYFEILNDLKLIDTSIDKSGHLITVDPNYKHSKEVKVGQVWSRINDSFSRPISSNEKLIHYIPTQYLSEIFKNAGYDGVIYKSALTENGYNVVLFDPKNAAARKGIVYEITLIKQSYNEITNMCNYKNEK